MSAMWQPAEGLGCRITEFGDNIFAVSAMKSTPQNTITPGASHFC
jgi:hypothetical protein